jgi:hypothetical protein
MPAIIPASKIQLSLGNRVGVLATFSPEIDDGDTWETGLGKVEAIFATASGSGITIGATYSGGMVTFNTTGGSFPNAKILAIGLA